ncbi:MAG: DUF2299 family protein [Thermoplasmata archaeon]
MKKQILEWLDDDDREYDLDEHPRLNWLIQLKHGGRVILLGNPKDYPKRLEVVYKLTVSGEHKQIISSMNPKTRAGFERAFIMLLSQNSVIYNIRRDDQGCPENVVIKKHLYDEDINRTLFFDTIQSLINVGMRTSVHFQSLGGVPAQDEDLSSTKPGPSLYR